MVIIYILDTLLVTERRVIPSDMPSRGPSRGKPHGQLCRGGGGSARAPGIWLLLEPSAGDLGRYLFFFFEREGLPVLESGVHRNCRASRLTVERDLGLGGIPQSDAGTCRVSVERTKTKRSSARRRAPPLLLEKATARDGGQSATTSQPRGSQTRKRERAGNLVCLLEALVISAWLILS